MPKPNGASLFLQPGPPAAGSIASRAEMIGAREEEPNAAATFFRMLRESIALPGAHKLMRTKRGRAFLKAFHDLEQDAVREGRGITGSVLPSKGSMAEMRTLMRGFQEGADPTSLGQALLSRPGKRR